MSRLKCCHIGCDHDATWQIFPQRYYKESSQGCDEHAIELLDDKYYEVTITRIVYLKKEVNCADCGPYDRHICCSCHGTGKMRVSESLDKMEWQPIKTAPNAI